MPDLKHFTVAMVKLAQIYRCELSKLAMDGYWRVLSRLSDDELLRATDRALERCKFMPAPSELLAFARGSVEAEISEAWGVVRGAMDSCDVWGSVDFGPLVNAVVRNMGGWREICEASVKDLIWRRKDFERLYRDFMDKPALKGAPLIGLHGGKPIKLLCPTSRRVEPKQPLKLVRDIDELIHELADK